MFVQSQNYNIPEIKDSKYLLPDNLYVNIYSFLQNVCRSGVPNLQFGSYKQETLPNCKFGTLDNLYVNIYKCKLRRWLKISISPAGTNTNFQPPSIAFNKMFVPFRSAKLTVWQLQTGDFAKL
jgi:hypothetical protein